MGVVEALEDGSVFSCIVRGANFDVTKEDIDRAEPVNPGGGSDDPPDGNSAENQRVCH